MPPKKKHAQFLPGLYPQHFRRKAVREFVDMDYTEKLNPEEKAWLSKFSAELYNGEFTETPLHNREQQKEIHRTLNRYQAGGSVADAFAVARTLGQLDHPDSADDPELAWESALNHQPLLPDLPETPEHFAAVEDLKRELPPLPKSDRTKVEVSANHKKALKKLIQLNKAEIKKRRVRNK